MKQDDGTGMNASGQLFESLLVGRLLILVPVYIGKTPEKSLIAEIFCHLQVLRAVFSLRRPVKFHHFLAGGLLVKSGNTVQLFGEGFLRGNFGHIRVRPGVVSDDMAFCRHAFDKIRLVGEKIADNKESRGCLMLLECVKDRRGVAVFIAAVKRQIDDVFFR